MLWPEVFLTGKYRSPEDAKDKARSGTVAKYLNDRGFGLIKVLDEVAKTVNATPAQVALAWLIVQPGITAPIASATNLDQLEDLAKAATLSLDAAGLGRLNSASGN